jgi:membrane protein required for colicin V production
MHMSQWTLFDCFFGAIILISMVLALMKGLAREIISLVALIGGFILAVIYYPAVGSRLAEFSRSDSVASFLGFLIIFIGCLLLGAIVAFVVNRFLKTASLQWVDRVLGGIFGLLRGWAISSIMVVALVAFPVRENLMARSFLAPYLLAGARTAVFLVPQHLKDRFNEQYKKVLQGWTQNRSAA